MLLKRAQKMYFVFKIDSLSISILIQHVIDIVDRCTLLLLQ